MVVQKYGLHPRAQVTDGAVREKRISHYRRNNPLHLNTFGGCICILRFKLFLTSKQHRGLCGDQVSGIVTTGSLAQTIHTSDTTKTPLFHRLEC